MYPKLFGAIDTYYLFLILGILSSFLILFIYLKVKKIDKEISILLFINGLISIFVGIVFANLAQNLYDFIKNPDNFKYSGNMTFLGGLIAGVITFVIFYFIVIRKKDKSIMKNIMIIAPSCITSAHFFGRMGCFFNGCCYGIESDSILVIQFPNLDHKVLPTQLFEAIFLLILTIILLIFAFKFDFVYNFSIYFLTYSVFRFGIEFIRGDDRGSFIGNLSPSQFWSIFLFIAGIIFIFISNYLYGKKKIIHKQ